VFWLTPTPISTRNVTTRWLQPDASPGKAREPVGVTR
jgi:hypothetical protein